MRWAFVAGLACTCAALVLGAGSDDADLASMVKPRYNDSGELAVPSDFREWVFVGSSLGLSYSEQEPEESRQIFHHVYMQPQAYRHYVKTGVFPEATMLVMENYSVGNKENQLLHGEEEFDNFHGRFEQKRVGLEVALKDHSHFEEGWAYFNFTSRTGLRDTAKAFPKAACWNCHNSHGADDNVFIQYYPVLREEFERRASAKKGL